MKEAALRYAQQWAWPVFPVTPGAKTPLTAHGFHDASTDPAQIEAWWSQWPDANIGVPTGAGSKVFVVDADVKSGKPGRKSFAGLKLPKTLASKTPSGGFHAFFSHSGEEIRNRTDVLPGIDIRGDGGYIVAPPSVVDGKSYRWIHEMRPAQAPPSLLKLLNGAKKSQSRRVAGNGSLKIDEGSRNHHLARLAGALASQGYNHDGILAAIRAENAQRCNPPLDDDEIQRTVMKSAEKWAEAEHDDAEPEPLLRPIPLAPAYPMAALGEILGPAAERIAEVVQAPGAIAGQSILAAASLAVQAHADVAIDGRREPLSLWCISIAESGERKSAADDIALEPHRIHERLAADQYRRDLVAHEAETAVYEEQRKTAIKGKVVDLKKVRELSNAIEADLRKIGAAPRPPLEPWLLVSTPTLEGLHKLYRDGKPSLGLFHDDGGEFLGGHTMSAEHRMKSAAGMSKLWDRGEFDRVRGGDGANKYYGRRLALHLLVQPIIAETILGDALLCGQGFLARALLAWPSTRIGTRRYAEVDLSTDPALVRYRSVITKLLERPAPTRPEAPQELEPRSLRLTPDAKRRWIGFHNQIEDAMRDGGELAGVRAWGSKAPAQVLRIAGVLVLVSDPAANEIDLVTIDRAAELVLHALEEAVRIVGTTSVPDEIRHAQALLDWCRESGITSLHSRAALRLGPACIRTKAVFDHAIRELERAGSAVPVAGGAEVDGVHRRRVWEIHP